jgi:asparagine synthase (glutamine-hydrolysing)
MCGFAGFLDGNLNSAYGEVVLEQMGEGIAHRGPDDSGVWLEHKFGLGLIHKRLSILDLSTDGRQPMHSHCGRFVIAYNGEIYNYKNLRSELKKKGRKFSSSTDTEVLLAAIEEWGLEECLSRIVGMFAFVLIDRREKLLHLVRDRIGEKPAYYGWQNKVFIFGSELKALRLHPSWVGGISDQALGDMLQLSYIPSPKTIHPEVYKVEPGSIVTIRFNREYPTEITKRKWWSYQELFQRTEDERCRKIQDEDIFFEWEKTFAEVISECQISDVPLGAFLSGGVDSSLVVAFMQEASSNPIDTFSIGFDDRQFDESVYAQRIADHLGTRHHSLAVSPTDVRDLFPALPDIYDEPFADSSQVLAVLVSRFARRSVTVALSGDGGDEMFGGYNRYKWAPQISDLLRWTPGWLRQPLSRHMLRTSKCMRQFESYLSGHSLIGPIKVPQLSRKIEKISEIVRTKDSEEIYRTLTRELLAKGLLVSETEQEEVDAFPDYFYSLWNSTQFFPDQLINADVITYLPDDILVKVDRASMASGLEVRAPFLDYRIIKLATSLPFDQKIRRGETKRILRKSLKKRIPLELFDRPKQGFSLPIASWLIGPLSEWAEDLLSVEMLKKSDQINVDGVRQLWGRHRTGVEDHSTVLWNVLMFQAWRDRYE